MSVHYKFKSGKDKHTVIFDGLHISVSDLKKAIMAQRKIGKSADLDLQITNPQTGEVYESNSALIPKNTSVEVARVPVSGAHKKNWDRLDNNSSKGAHSPSHIEVEKITKSSNISTSYSTEDEKIKAMMSDSTQEYDTSKYVKNRGPIGPLPSNYTCYRCGQPGHYIKQCPTNNTDVKRSTGIPRSFMIPANADQKGALLTASGDYAVPIIDHEAYKEIKKEKPPFMPSAESDKEVEVPEIPEDLKCTLCKDLLQDAVLIHCCGNSYCDECIRSVLLESETHECPTCHEVNVSPDTLIPNRYLRTSVTKFKNDTGYRKHKVVTLNVNNTTVNTVKPVQQNKPEIQLNDNKVEEVVKNEETFNTIESKLIEEELKSQSSPKPMEAQSPLIVENNTSTDVTMDEVILGSPKRLDLTPKTTEITVSTAEETVVLQTKEENESIDDGTDSQQESATGPNTPLVDEPSESYESAVEPTPQIEANPVVTLGQYHTQPLLPMSAYQRPPPRMVGPIRSIRTTLNQQSNPTLLGRPQAILPHPRGVYPRPGMTQDGRYPFGPMSTPRGYPMPMGHSMPPYGYPPQMRPPSHYDPYGYMGPRSHMPTGPIHHQLSLQGMSEAPPPGSSPLLTDPHYPYPKPEYDDYEDRLNRFTRSLESRSRGRPKPTRSISRSRSRSRTNTRSSRTRSSSTSSSTSSSSSSRSSRFSFSSRSFSGSSRSRSRSFSPRNRRSRSRSHYRRRSRSPSPRHRDYGREVRYRRSRSPQSYDTRRYGDKSRGRYEKGRERDSKYRDQRNSRYERNDTSYRSSHRSDDRKKESKQTHSSRCNHKSIQDKSRTNEETRVKTRSKTPLKDEAMDKSSESVVKTEQSIDSIEVKATESESNKSKLTQNPSEIVDTIRVESDKTVESEEKNKSSDRKKSKDKSKKHHKHHHNHHNHQKHKHRKSSDDNKDIKKTEDLKSSSNKRSKKTKKETTEQTIAVEEVKTSVVPKQSSVEETSVESTPDIELKDETKVLETFASNDSEYVPEMASIKPMNDLVITEYDLVNDFKVETNTENSFEVFNEIQTKSEEKLELSEYISTELPNYSTIESTEDKSEVMDTIEDKAVTEVSKESDVRAIHLVDYTDNEDLVVEHNNELTDKVSENIIINDLNNSCDNNVPKTDELTGASQQVMATAIEVPKSKWDEDMNDLRFEEDYSDFEDNTKPIDTKTSSSSAKKSLPNDIIEKAEKAILEKPLRIEPIVDTKRDKTASNDSKKYKTTKSEEKSTKKSSNESIESEKTKDKSRDRDRNDDYVDNNGNCEESDDKSGVEGGEGSLPRKVKLDRSKFAEKPTLSITIDNSEKESKSSRDRKSDDNNKDSKQRSSSHYKSSRDRSKERQSRSGDKGSRKKSSKSSKSRDNSRHRSHKRSRHSRTRSRSPSIHRSEKKYKSSEHKTDDKTESSSSHKKSKSKYSSNSSNKKSK